MGTQGLLLSIKSKEFYPMWANLVNIFEALNDLNLILQRKNINRYNHYHAISAFTAKLRLDIVELKKMLLY